MRDLNIPWSDIQRMNYFEFVEYINLLEEEARKKQESYSEQEKEYDERMKHNQGIPDYQKAMRDMQSNFKMPDVKMPEMPKI